MVPYLRLFVLGFDAGPGSCPDTAPVSIAEVTNSCRGLDSAAAAEHADGEQADQRQREQARGGEREYLGRHGPGRRV